MQKDCRAAHLGLNHVPLLQRPGPRAQSAVELYVRGVRFVIKVRVPIGPVWRGFQSLAANCLLLCCMPYRYSIIISVEPIFDSLRPQKDLVMIHHSAHFRSQSPRDMSHKLLEYHQKVSDQSRNRKWDSLEQFSDIFPEWQPTTYALVMTMNQMTPRDLGRTW